MQGSGGGGRLFFRAFLLCLGTNGVAGVLLLDATAVDSPSEGSSTRIRLCGGDPERDRATAAVDAIAKYEEDRRRGKARILSIRPHKRQQWPPNFFANSLLFPEMAGNKRKRQKVETATATAPLGSDSFVPADVEDIEKDDEERELESVLFGTPFVPSIAKSAKAKGKAVQRDDGPTATGLDHVMDEDVRLAPMSGSSCTYIFN